MCNPFQSQHLELHILQSFPVTCLNRDDVGAPKTAVVGGVSRSRVSSQCWKRQVRQELHNFGVKLAVRTKQLENIMTTACIALGATEEKAGACGKAFAKELADDTLFFFSDKEAELFANHAQSLDFAADKIKAKEVAKLVKKAIVSAQDGLDIALFGRMVAKAADMNVEAAASFSHAISTHKASNEIEFFTALDDLAEEPGSAHMGSLEFNSATYYRYVSLDLGQLYQNLFGDMPCTQEQVDDLKKAVDAFINALYVAIPSARQTTQSGACFWDYAHILVRKGQRLQASFDEPVRAKNGYVTPSIEALENFIQAKKQQAGSLFQQLASIRFGQGIEASIDSVKDEIKAVIDDIFRTSNK